jgi:hypothetical protein
MVNFRHYNTGSEAGEKKFTPSSDSDESLRKEAKKGSLGFREGNLALSL